MNQGYTRRLAEFCAHLSFESLPSSVVERMQWALLDSLGIMLGASVTDMGKQVADFVKDLQDREEATALGFGFKSSTRNAAFLNGTLSDVLELQDGYWNGPVHPSSVVIPSALAVAEYSNKSGRDFLLSIVVGYEVTNRVSQVMHPSHSKRGFAPTGTAGTIGAAAAVGKLLGFDPDQMFNAIGIAGFILPVSPVENWYGGYTIKPVNSGAAAKVGIEAAMLAQKGFTACSLEGDPESNRGFCVIVSDHPNFGKMTEGLGEKYTIHEVYVKPYACCRSNHGPIEIVLDLARHHSLRPSDVEAILIKTDGDTASIQGQIRTDPKSDPGRCLPSLSYCVAVALMDGQVGPEQFSPERIKDPKVHQLATCINVVADSEMDRLRPEKRPAIVEISLKNGLKVSGRVDYPKGDSQNPMSGRELLEKFEGLAYHVLSEEKVKRVISVVLNFEKITDVGELVRLCF